MIPISLKRETDREGRVYLSAEIPEVKGIFIDGFKNHEFEGVFKVKLRLGNSKFGEEIIFELFTTQKIKEYVRNSPRERTNFEIYLPKEKGIELLKEAINYFEMNI